MPYSSQTTPFTSMVSSPISNPTPNLRESSSRSQRTSRVATITIFPCASRQMASVARTSGGILLLSWIFTFDLIKAALRMISPLIDKEPSGASRISLRKHLHIQCMKILNPVINTSTGPPQVMNEKKRTPDRIEGLINPN